MNVPPPLPPSPAEYEIDRGRTRPFDWRAGLWGAGWMCGPFVAALVAGARAEQIFKDFGTKLGWATQLLLAWVRPHWTFDVWTPVVWTFDMALLAGTFAVTAALATGSRDRRKVRRAALLVGLLLAAFVVYALGWPVVQLVMAVSHSGKK